MYRGKKRKREGETSVNEKHPVMCMCVFVLHDDINLLAVNESVSHAQNQCEEIEGEEKEEATVINTRT